MPCLAAIRVFPIKSLDGVSLNECRVLPSGALEQDRSLAIFDSDGNFINAKRQSSIHRVRAMFDLTNQTVSLSGNASPPAQFDLREEQAEMSAWLSDFFGFSVEIRGNVERGFPDDVDSPGPTIVSTATLQAVAGWFSGVPVSEMNRRFRANLELGGEQSFWEDRLCGEQASVRFRIGDVEFVGTNPCQRCVVPSRAPVTGEPIPAFARIFSEQRQRSLPAWAPVSRFDHFYRLAINTRLAALHSGQLRIGDEVQILS